MTRIEIPIPQQEEARQPHFKFFELKDKTVAVEAQTLEDHIAAFRNVTDELDDHYWAQAAVAASLSKKFGTGEYGKKQMEGLAAAVDLSTGYLFKMARTYRTFTENYPRVHNLYFKHHVIAAYHTKPDEALAVAAERRMSCAAFAEWVSEQTARRASKATRKARNAARNSWREHLLHMDDVIVSDFIKNSPNQEFARRVCSEWRVELADELKQLDILDRRELIINAIDERGAEDVKAIKQATGIDRKEIDWIVAQLVEENLYEWMDKGGKTEVGRGTPSKILHKVGEADGTAFHFPRIDHEYAH